MSSATEGVVGGRVRRLRGRDEHPGYGPVGIAIYVYIFPVSVWTQGSLLAFGRSYGPGGLGVEVARAKGSAVYFGTRVRTFDPIRHEGSHF